jgi:uncharacterized protein (TIGR03435 family)
VLRAMICAAICWAASGQTAAFDAASVKPSKSIVGHDGVISIDPIRFSARNATLKRLIFEAYQVPWSQIAGGPAWIDRDEFDIEARAESPASPEQTRLMLRTLLHDRFALTVHSEVRERRVYVLVIGKDGPKLHGAAAPDDMRAWRFHGNMSQFADRLSIQLAIPFLDDPTIPSHPSGPPTPVVDKTGIEGDYDINVDLKPEPGVDPFTFWQRVLQEQLGLKLESRPAPVEFLVIDHAEKSAR